MWTDVSCIAMKHFDAITYNRAPTLPSTRYYHAKMAVVTAAMKRTPRPTFFRAARRP